MRHEPSYPDFHVAPWTMYIIAAVMLAYDARWYILGAAGLGAVWLLA